MSEKPYIEWQSKYEVGVDFIDAQHRGLVRVINELHAGLQDRFGDRSAAFERAAHQAVEYVKSHFAAEEKWMRETGYDGYERQRAAHAHFIKTLLECAGKFKPGDLRTSFDFLKFLSEWLISHIAIEDNNFRFHHKGRQAKKEM